MTNTTTAWHAHMSSLSMPSHRSSGTQRFAALVQSHATAQAAPTTRPTEEPRQHRSLKSEAVGTTLDTSFVGVPIALRQTSKTWLTVHDTCAKVKVRSDTDVDFNHRSMWVAHPASDDGDYNIVSLGCDGECKFLAAKADGTKVTLEDQDDGSGLQRWIFSQIGDSQFHIHLNGGKEDDAIFLGRSENQVKLFSKPDDTCEWTLSALEFCDSDDGKKASQASQSSSSSKSTTKSTPKSTTKSTTQVPSSAVEELSGAFTERDMDIILQLISLPENGHPKWHKNYGYIEFLGDGRGFTATLFGACSGTGDLYMIFDELDKLDHVSEACKELLKYKDKLKSKRGDDIKGIEPIKSIIKKLGDDPSWQRAVWKVYVKLYWRFALDFAAKQGSASKRPGPKLTSAGAKGFMVDTAINHGANMDSFKDILRRMPDDEIKDETAWLVAFADAREKLLKSGYQDLDTSKTGDRCKLWKELIRKNPTLKTPIEAYKGYWGSYNVA